MTSPSIAVAVPSFNQATYLERALDSILSQGYSPLEVYVMDGGSSDGSAEIISSLEEELAGWRSEPDDGQGGAILDGWTKSTADVITWLNSDDLLLPGALRAAAKLFSQGADVVIGDTVLIDEDDAITRYMPLWPAPRWMYSTGMIPVAQPGTFYRRSLAESVGYFDRHLAYAMEFDLWHRLMQAGATLRYADRALAALRIYENTKSAGFADELNDETRDVRQRHEPFRGRR